MAREFIIFCAYMGFFGEPEKGTYDADHFRFYAEDWARKCLAPGEFSYRIRDKDKEMGDRARNAEFRRNRRNKNKDKPVNVVKI